MTTLKFVLMALLALGWQALPAESLKCGEVLCPGIAHTCSLKYVIVTKSRKKVTTVSCFDHNRRQVAQESYDTPLSEKEFPIPVVECGGHRCKPGAYNCTTVSTPLIKRTPPIETTHLTCRDDLGTVIEERNIVRTLSLKEATGETPPTCEGHTCPKGSRSCSYDTIIQLEPYSKNTHVVCYDIKSKITSDVKI